MGLPLQALRLMLLAHAAEPFQGPVLTLGRQDIQGANYEQILQLFASVGITPVPLTSELHPHGPPTLDVIFFAHLGLKLQSLDYSDYEHADIVHDLNEPIPEDLKGKFGLVIDGGTLEHVFDIRQALRNTVELLAPGGRVYHFSPVNNYVNHGFWQFSPTLFFDFYQKNEFADTNACLIIHHRDDPYDYPWGILPYNHVEDCGMSGYFNSVENQLFVLFSARKTAFSTSTGIPTQTVYRLLYEGKMPNRVQNLFEYAPEGLRVNRRIFVPA